MNILITGGAGYIGSHTALSLIDKGHKVSIIDNLITGSRKLIPKNAKFYKCDIINYKKVSEILQKNRFDAVIHFAGLIKVEESVKYPKKYEYNNYTKSKKFIDICIKNKLNNIIFSSTASIYGHSKKKNCKENSKLNPQNPYAKTKFKIENFIIKRAKQKKLNYIILRYFNVAGADRKLRSGLLDKKSSHLIKVACEVATKKKNFFIINGSNYRTSDKTAVRDFIHVTDLSEIHILSISYLLKKKKSQIFNCGYGKGFSVLQIIKSFNELLNNKIEYRFGPRRPGDIEKLVSNCNKVKKTLKWKPKYNQLKTILKTALNWEKKKISFK